MYDTYEKYLEFVCRLNYPKYEIENFEIIFDESHVSGRLRATFSPRGFWWLSIFDWDLFEKDDEGTRPLTVEEAHTIAKKIKPVNNCRMLFILDKATERVVLMPYIEETEEGYRYHKLGSSQVITYTESGGWLTPKIFKEGILLNSASRSMEVVTPLLYFIRHQHDWNERVIACFTS